MGVAEQIGGLPSLTTVFVVLTGITGALLGQKSLDLLRIRNHIGLNQYLIRVAPAPLFARFKGLNNGMAGFVKMLDSVGTRRRFAAPYVATNQAKAQVNPVSARF